MALHADTSSLTAIGNDYGPEEAFARQVHAHGRPGDVLVALSTSGQSPNVLHAVDAAPAPADCETWSLTGDGPNPLSRRCDEAVLVPGPTATVQEAHLVAIHLVCTAVDARVQELVGDPEMEAVS